MVTDKMRAEIIEANGTLSANELAAIYRIDRSDILRIWFKHAMGYRPVSMRANTKRISFGTNSPSVEVKPLRVEPEALVTGGLTLMELEDRHCRWIIGRDENNDTRYCGVQRAHKVKPVVRRYCECHGQIAILGDARQEIVIEPRFPSPARLSEYQAQRSDNRDLLSDAFDESHGMMTGSHHLDMQTDGMKSAVGALIGEQKRRYAESAKAHQSETRH